MDGAFGVMPDIPRVRLPDSLTLPHNPARTNAEDEDEEDEADEQHVSLLNAWALCTLLCYDTSEPCV